MQPTIPLQNTVPPLPAPPTGLPPTPRWRKWWPWIMLGVLVLGISAGAAWWMLRPKAAAPAEAAKNQPVQTAVVATGSVEAAYDDYSHLGIKEFSAANKTAVIAAYRTLAEGFTLNDSFYKDSVAMLHALGAAYLYSRHPDRKTLYRNELYLTTMDYLQALPSGINDNTFMPARDAANIQAVLQKYQDADLTKRVEQAPSVQADMATAAKNLKLGGVDKLAAFKFVALGFDSSSTQWQQFSKEHPMYGASPMMWVEKLGDMEYIVMMKPYAEDVIAGRKNSLLHEFIHTQTAFVRGEAGRIVEERRAELLSGDASAYYDAKQALLYLRVFSGVDFTALLTDYPTDATTFFAGVYATVGVEGANGLVFSWPTVYLNNPTGAMITALDSGGLNAAMKAAITAGNTNKPAMEQRVKDRYASLLKVFKTKERVLQDLRENLGGAYNMPAAATEMEQFVLKQ